MPSVAVGSNSEIIFSPGSWNQKQEGTAVVSMVTQAEMAQPPEIEKLKEKDCRRAKTD